MWFKHKKYQDKEMLSFIDAPIPVYGAVAKSVHALGSPSGRAVSVAD